MPPTSRRRFAICFGEWDGRQRTHRRAWYVSGVIGSKIRFVDFFWEWNSGLTRAVTLPVSFSFLATSSARSCYNRRHAALRNGTSVRAKSGDRSSKKRGNAHLFRADLLRLPLVLGALSPRLLLLDFDRERAVPARGTWSFPKRKSVLCDAYTAWRERTEDLHEVERRRTETLACEDSSDLDPLHRPIIIVVIIVVVVVLVLTLTLRITVRRRRHRRRRPSPPRSSTPPGPLAPQTPRRRPCSSSHKPPQPDQELVRVERVAINLELSSLERSGFRSGDQDARVEDRFRGAVDLVKEGVGVGDLIRQRVDGRVLEVAAGVCRAQGRGFQSVIRATRGEQET